MRPINALVWSVLALFAFASPLGAAEVERCGKREATIVGKPGQKEIVGTDGPDVIVAQLGTRFIEGKGGRDTICAGPGNNAIDPGPGGDRVNAGPGIDQIDADATDIVRGGAGPDTAHYVPLKRLESGVEVDLAKGVVSSVVDLGGDDPHGRISDVEIVTGTEFADELRGDRRLNHLFGEDGRDFLDGRGGGDKLKGGDGDDEVSYESARASVEMTDGEGPYRFAQVGGTHTDSIAYVEIVTGSDFDDRLRGIDDKEHLYGGKGDDTITGLGGDDKLFGGPGDDIIAPGAGNDRVEGGDNRDVTGKDQHGDLVSFEDAKPRRRKDGTLEGMEVHLDLGLPPYESPFQPRRRFHATGEGNDIITGVESVRGIEGAWSTMWGDDGRNVLIGGGKVDGLHGSGGDDFLFGRGGEDFLHGDDGNDYLDPGGSSGQITNGGEGNDTCVQPNPEYRESCEKIEGRGDSARSRAARATPARIPDRARAWLGTWSTNFGRLFIWDVYRVRSAWVAKGEWSHDRGERDFEAGLAGNRFDALGGCWTPSPEPTTCAPLLVQRSGERISGGYWANCRNGCKSHHPWRGTKKSGAFKVGFRFTQRGHPDGQRDVRTQLGGAGSLVAQKESHLDHDDFPSDATHGAHAFHLQHLDGGGSARTDIKIRRGQLGGARERRTRLRLEGSVTRSDFSECQRGTPVTIHLSEGRGGATDQIALDAANPDCPLEARWTSLDPDRVNVRIDGPRETS